MSSHRISIEQNWRVFENVVRRVLEANQFEIEAHAPRGDSGFDFLGIRENEIWAIEVKYYRTPRARPTLIAAAAARVANNGLKDGAQKAMLVISSALPGDMRVKLESEFSIAFIDRFDLRALASGYPALAEELDALIELDPDFETKLSSEAGFHSRVSRRIDEKELPLPDMRGSNLCERLKNTRRGKDQWPEYEALCIEMLKYLFPSELQGWHAQKRTYDSVSRYDLICRIRPVTEFWEFIVKHLNSRYMLFEFKNRSAKIKQGEVLTTEKYLLARGLRRVAIILARSPADTNAIKMMQGAMREHGKLIMVIDDEILCEMLHMKGRGEDPTDKLFELVDDFLMALPR